MKISDRIYGEVEINDTVLIELINSKPLQRIKDVNQAGTQLVQVNRTITRYDHCVGTMILLRNFGARLEEQIAGLLHDVPHTAFSHAIDFAFREVESQTYHEKFLKKIVFNSEIPAILEKYNIDPEYVTDEHNFSLLEQEIPALCADRIDYSLRDIQSDGSFSKKDIEKILSSITVSNGRFVMTDEKVAYSYAKAFMDQCLGSWNAPETLATFELIGELIRVSLKAKIIVEDDLFGTDSTLLNKLRRSDNSRVKGILAKLTPNLRFELNETNFDFATKGKVRYIDPPILKEDELVPLSKLNPAFQRDIASFILKAKAGHKLRIIS
jgi:hypothetical protein